MAFSFFSPFVRTLSGKRNKKLNTYIFKALPKMIDTRQRRGVQVEHSTAFVILYAYTMHIYIRMLWTVKINVQKIKKYARSGFFFTLDDSTWKNHCNYDAHSSLNN